MITNSDMGIQILCMDKKFDTRNDDEIKGVLEKIIYLNRRKINRVKKMYYF